jgi:membrane protease YdiL (CAAX protease family)
VEHFRPLAAWPQDLLLLTPLPLVLIANLHQRWTRAGNRESWQGQLGALAWPLVALMGAGVVLLGLLDALSALARIRTSHGSFTYAAVLVVTGLAVAALSGRPARAALARVLPVDPDSALDITALTLTAVLFGNQVANQLSSNVLAQVGSGQELTTLDLLAQEIPFLVMALFGVGLFLRRPVRPALFRLGIVRPTVWQMLLALAAAGIFVAFATGADALAAHITPGLERQVNAANQHLFGRLEGPGGIAAIALAAGICEEALFRGALQPRLGLLWPALVFASVHTQYGLSLDTAAVFVLAIGLGWLRRVTNTTSSMICHVVYNAVVGVGIAVPVAMPALATEAVLLAVSGFAAFTGRLGPTGAPA